ncbi:MAG: branched-chain amino acid transport system II carrier protein [Tissierellia bacterium]|nr:branched-chain amino acid transport system II carrier protein [Tissierellia bacterium]
MDILIIGFALFAMFFGAGNLIFPATLGRLYASSWQIAGLGFSITGVGLTLLAVLSMAKKRGDIFTFTKISGEKFSKVITFLIILCIGPAFALPRTAATSMEIFDAVGFSINHLLFALVFFGLTLFLAIRPNNVIDAIGKYLTPLLLITLLILIIRGIASPIGDIKVVKEANVFSNSLLEGYNTMDAIAAIVFTPIIVKAVMDKGYEHKYMKMMSFAGIIAIVGLGFVYISLTYLGASTSSVLEGEKSRVDLLIYIATELLHGLGKYVLSIAMVLACLTTSVGLTSSLSEIFNRFFGNKLGYDKFVIILVLVSAIISVGGVGTIVELAVPILSFIYPIAVLLIGFNFIDEKIKHKKIMTNTFFVVGVISFIQASRDMINTIERLFGLSNSLTNAIASVFDKIIKALPLNDLGFPWIVPFLIVLIASIIFYNIIAREKDVTVQTEIN